MRLAEELAGDAGQLECFDVLDSRQMPIDSGSQATMTNRQTTRTRRIRRAIASLFLGVMCMFIVSVSGAIAPQSWIGGDGLLVEIDFFWRQDVFLQRLHQQWPFGEKVSATFSFNFISGPGRIERLAREDDFPSWSLARHMPPNRALYNLHEIATGWPLRAFADGLVDDREGEIVGRTGLSLFHPSESSPSFGFPGNSGPSNT